MAYDLLIKNGRIIDGTGAPGYEGSVAVTDGMIAAVGEADGGAARTIDAHGMAVTPGFIDNHCHFDAQATWDPLCTYSCYHGVTTVIFGNCSLALAPAREEDQYFLMQMLSRIEAIPLEALQAGLKWTWGSIAGYMDALDQRLGINAGVLIGHSAVRRYTMGEASQEREATGAEIEEMKGIIRDGLKAGALGLSFNRNPAHFDMHGRPVPGIVAPMEELYTLAEALREVGTGVIQSGASYNQEIKERYCTRLSEISGRHVVYNQISHRWSAPNHWREHLAVVEERLREGSQAYPLINPRPGNNRFTLRNAQTFDRLPAWQPLMMRSPEEKMAAFRDAEVRRRLHADAVEGVGIPFDAFSRRWDKVWVTDVALDKNRGLVGKSVEEIAQEQGKDVLDAFLDLALEEDLNTEFALNQTGGDDDAMAALLSHPSTVIGLSDGGAHVIFDAGYGYSTLLLGHWVREKHALPLEQAVHKLTAAQASLFGLEDRGVLRPGMAADIVVFDPETVAPEPAEMVSDLPGGGRRLNQLSRGIEYTVVNGQVLLEGNEHTGAYPGRVLRNSAYKG
jgi:N-acyl-D-aspartate/D-glutamate deacylase